MSAKILGFWTPPTLSAFGDDLQYCEFMQTPLPCLLWGYPLPLPVADVLYVWSLAPFFLVRWTQLQPLSSPDLCTISSEADKIAVKAITEGDSLDTHLTGKFPHLPQISDP